MNTNFDSLLSAVRYFSCPENCHNFLVSLRWPNGVECPHCGSQKVGKFSGKRRVSNCKNCKKQFTVKVGTIFEDSALGLDKWLPAVWLIVSSKNGISSCELARSLGITQKSAWHMGHRIRAALEAGTVTKLQGTVEVDESYIGGKARFMHKAVKKRKGISGISGKTPIMGLLERHSGKKGESRIVAEVIPYLSSEL
jgi:transposase-like protein